MSHLEKTTYADIGRRLREIPPETSCASYEWEELVEKLCSSEDAGLQRIGIKELEELKHKPLENGAKKV